MPSPLADNDCFAPLFRDAQLASLFSADRTIAHFLAFEQALTHSLRDCGLVDAALAEAALLKMQSFEPDMAAIGKGALKDGLPVPEFVRQLKAHLGPDLSAAFHDGATGQDLVDTSLMLSLSELSNLLAMRLETVIAHLRRLEERFGKQHITARTRMQAALPITVADRLDNWQTPLETHLAALPALRNQTRLLQFGGASGTRHAFGDRGDEVAAHLAAQLGLGDPPKCWHSIRLPIVAYGNWLSEITGSLGKMGMDITLMVQQGIEDISLSGGGASSSMPHKSNPVLAEILVTFARYNATQLAGLHQALVHEQERSGMALTLEWMILPQMAQVTGKALQHAASLLASVDRIGKS